MQVSAQTADSELVVESGSANISAYLYIDGLPIATDNGELSHIFYTDEPIDIIITTIPGSEDMDRETFAEYVDGITNDILEFIHPVPCESQHETLEARTIDQLELWDLRTANAHGGRVDAFLSSRVTWNWHLGNGTINGLGNGQWHRGNTGITNVDQITMTNLFTTTGVRPSFTVGSSGWTITNGISSSSLSFTSQAFVTPVISHSFSNLRFHGVNLSIRQTVTNTFRFGHASHTVQATQMMFLS